MTRWFLLYAVFAACGSSGDRPGDDDAPTPGITDTWIGTATYTLEYTGAPGFTNTKVTHAEVTWTFDETRGSHVPSGTVDFSEIGSYDNPPGPPCQLGASYSGPIDPSSSNLMIDETTYAGIGVEINAIVLRTDSCNGMDNFPTPLQWMPSRQGDIAGDSIDLDETSPAGGDSTQHVEYHYTKQR